MKQRRRVPHPVRVNDPKFRTRQQPAEQTDINGIVERARRGIAPTWINSRKPVYADLTQVPKDLLSAYKKIEAAEEAFISLPAKIRTAMDNNPLNLASWLEDPANREDAEYYGLLVKKEKPTPSPASPNPSSEEPSAPQQGKAKPGKKIEE